MQKAKDLRTMGQGEANKGQDRASSGWEAVIPRPAPFPPDLVTQRELRDSAKISDKRPAVWRGWEPQLCR